MRSIRALSHHPIRLFAAASVAVLLVGQAGCGLFGSSAPKQPMQASNANTSGEGTVQAKADPDGNTQLDVRVKHLSSPAKVAPDASVYVVWIQPQNGQIQNVGALQVDSDLVGELKTTTPHQAFILTVTPEPSARMAAPTHPAVFSANVTQSK